MGVAGPKIEPCPSNLAKMHIFLIHINDVTRCLANYISYRFRKITQEFPFQELQCSLARYIKTQVSVFITFQSLVFVPCSWVYQHTLNVPRYSALKWGSIAVEVWLSWLHFYVFASHVEVQYTAFKDKYFHCCHHNKSHLKDWCAWLWIKTFLISFIAVLSIWQITSVTT